MPAPQSRLKTLQRGLTALASDVFSNFTLRAVLLIVTAAFVVSFAHGCHQDQRITDYQTKLKAWQAQTAVLVARNDSLSKVNVRVNSLNDSLTKTAESKEATADRLKTTASRLRAKNDSLLAKLGSELPDTCRAALDLAGQYRAEADTLHKAVDSLQSANGDLHTANDSLKTQNGALAVQNDSLARQLRKVPVYKPEKILGFIPLPSRKQAFVTGTVVGVVVTAIAIVRFH